MTRLDRVSSGLTAAAGVAAASSAAAAIVQCRSMSAMDMPMPGGWTMSMAWMRQPDQSWLGAAVGFLAMWLVMMVAMMVPAILPALHRYAAALERRGETAMALPLAVAAAGYLCVWAAAGLAVFPIGASLSALAMARPRVSAAMPFAIGAALLAAGAWQLTRSKARALACCSDADGAAHAPGDPRSAWRHGLQLGLTCLRCCGSLMVVLLVVGVMDLAAMTVVTVAIIAERAAPHGERIARIVGVWVIAGAVAVVARALHLT